MAEDNAELAARLQELEHELEVVLLNLHKFEPSFMLIYRAIGRRHNKKRVSVRIASSSIQLLNQAQLRETAHPPSISVPRPFAEHSFSVPSANS